MEINSQEYKEYLNEEYLSTHEAAELLETTEEEVRGLIHGGALPSHNIAGVFLRLKKKEVEELKNKWRIERELFPKPEPVFSHHNVVEKAVWLDRWKDFWYFNDFYILCAALIAALIYFIVVSQ